MDIEEARDWLGERGEQGVLALAVGLLVVASSDKRAAAGVAVVVAGIGLVATGLVDSALERLGMEGMV